MNKPSLKLCNLALATALVGMASPAAAASSPSLSIVLHVCDDVGIQTNLVSRAKAEMSRIYRDVGIDVAWISDASLIADPDGPQPPAASDRHLTLVILCRELTEEMTVGPTALGGAVGTREYRGQIAYVFYDRVEQISRTFLNLSREPGTDDMYNVILLAHAMAHEVGHLLLPYGHSPTGLMRAEWDAKDMRLAMDRRLNFTSEQAELIRGQLLTQVADTRPPASN
jgi:hypothetical protein